MKRLTEQDRVWRSVPEADVLRAVLDYLSRRGVYAWRNNTGSTVAEHNGRRRFIRFSEPGAADVFCIFNGRFVAVETKTETGKQSQEQRDWQAAIERAGGTYVIARPSNYAEVIDAAIGRQEAV